MLVHTAIQKTRAHTRSNIHIHESLIVTTFLFSPRSVSEHGELAVHSQFTSSLPPYFLFFPHSSSLRTLSLSLLLFLASSFTCPLLFLTPALPTQPSPPSLSLSHLPPPGCFGVCGSVSRRGWWLIGSWWFGRTPDTGAASQCGNV